MSKVVLITGGSSDLKLKGGQPVAVRYESNHNSDE
jgi:hypothetical protein